ncbi:MAG: MFS transporter [Acidimicrobiia bacterium]
MTNPGRPGADRGGAALAFDDDATAAVPVVGDRTVVVRMFGSRAFFRLWIAMFCSATGDWLGFLAIADLAARLGGESSGALAVGFVFMARMLPGLLFGAVVGVFVDRFDRRRVMVVCDLGRALVLLSLPFVDSVPGLIAASLVLELLTLAWQPAKEATVPNLVPQSHLASANSLSIAAGYGTFPLAAALFAVLAKFGESVDGSFVGALRFGQEGTLGFYVDALTFVISAAIISRLVLPPRPARTAARRTEADAGRGPLRSVAGAWTDLKEGWSFIATNPVVRAVNVGLATGLVGGGMLVPLGKIFIDRVLHAGSAGFGLFLTVLGVGVATGVLTVSVLQNRLPKERVFAGVVLASGVCLFAATSTSSLTPAAVLIFGLGVCAGTAYVLGFTLLHENVDDELRGRIFSALNTLVRLCLVSAFAVGPFLTQLFDQLSARLFTNSRVELFGARIFVPGVRLTMWLAASIMVTAGVLAARSIGWRRSLPPGTRPR